MSPMSKLCSLSYNKSIWPSTGTENDRFDNEQFLTVLNCFQFESFKQYFF